jgi:membrane fusion protein (multidrug efflux system)
MTQWLRRAAEATGRKRLNCIPTGSMLILGTVLLTGCGKAPAAAGPPQALPVSVVQVEATDVPVSNEWVGTLDGYVNAQIQPQANGYLIRQNYREGTQVAKGQVLFEIDPRPFQAALDQAKGQLDQAHGQVLQAQAQLGLAEINVKRDTPLAQARAISQSQLDNDVQQKAQTEASVQSAKASVAAAEAAVENAQLNLGFTHVRSLITGVAGQATTQVGNLVNTQSVLTSVSQLNPIKVYFSISDSEYLGLIQRARGAGGDLLKSENAIPLTLTLANGEVYPVKGHIDFVDRQMNAQTGAIRIAAQFPNPNNLLRPGQFGRVKGETQLRHNALLIPQVAVQELQGMQQVYVAGADGKAHLTTVELGPQVGNNWLVDGGIAPGAQVIVDNLQKLREGSPVSPHPAAAVASATSATGR